MTKAKKQTVIVKDATGDVVAEVASEQRYRNIPVDRITHKKLMELCDVRGFGQRGQGALVRILINNSYEAEFSSNKKKA